MPSETAGILLLFAAASATAFAVYQVTASLVHTVSLRVVRRRRLLLMTATDDTEGEEISFSAEQLTKLKQQIRATKIWQGLIEPTLKRRREEELRQRCIDDLPEMIDILSLSLGAGLSFDVALTRYTEAFDTPLAHEFAAAQQAYRVGMCSRIQAFEQVAERLQEEAILRFVASIRQASTLGSSLTNSFETLAFEARRYRKARLEERIAKTPVKLLIPLGLCILPAVLLLLMGPVMMQVISGLNF